MSTLAILGPLGGLVEFSLLAGCPAMSLLLQNDMVAMANETEIDASMRTHHRHEGEQTTRLGKCHIRT